MPTYRLYRLDGAGRIAGADWVEAADDDEARLKAAEQANSAAYEVWDRYRLVHRLAASGPIIEPPPEPA